MQQETHQQPTSPSPASNRKAYRKPQLKYHGSIAQLTQVGAKLTTFEDQYNVSIEDR
jgi:hypothetical protein